MVIFVVTLLAARDMMQIVNAEVLKLQLERGKIAILSDALDPHCSLVTRNLYKVVKKYYSKSEIIPIYSFKDLTMQLKEDYFVKVYVFRGNLDGVKIGYDEVSWKVFANLLNSHKAETIFGSEAHVIASGDGDVLKTYLEPYEGFYVEPSPILDIRLSYFFHLWTIADILENDTAYRTKEMLEAGECIRKSALYYFSKDFNDLFSRIIQPIDVFGELPPSDFSEESLNNATIIQTYPAVSTPVYEKPLFLLGSSKQNIAESASLTGGGGSGPPDSFINPNIGDLYDPFIKLPSNTSVDGPAGKILDNVIALLINNCLLYTSDAADE